MPIYEYQCDACQHHLEALQKITESPLRKCPACGKTKLRRLISPPVFRLKGSGWYETDFKSDKENKRNLAIEKEESPAATDSSKPADKKESAPKPAAASPATPAATKPAARRPAAAPKKKVASRSGKRSKVSARR
jgi:putative FmdB family regulatory protein